MWVFKVGVVFYFLIGYEIGKVYDIIYWGFVYSNLEKFESVFYG